VALGAPTERVVVTGNLKYDFAEPSENSVSAWVGRELANGTRGPVLIAGSVMVNEEDAILRAFEDVEREFPRALLILAPRKPEQFERAASIVSQAGRKLVRRSKILLNGSAAGGLSDPGSVFLLDSLGELASLYRLADVVFVGGSLVPIGGHNILEPAAFSKVPIYGPSMENFRAMATQFLSAKAAIEVKSAEELGAAWKGLLGDPTRAVGMGERARGLAYRNRGATAAVLEHIERVIGADRGES